MTAPDDTPIGSTAVARWWLATVVPGVAVSLLLIALLQGRFETPVEPVSVPPGPAGTVTFEPASRSHVPGTVPYEQVPPVGGDHSPIWATCGVYDSPVVAEQAVHAMEHGAVWLTYDPSELSSDAVAHLQHLAKDNYEPVERMVIVSPYDGLPTPVVASAWGRQLTLESVDDPRLGQFLQDFAGGSQAPEPGNPCAHGGLGVPLDGVPSDDEPTTGHG